MLEERASQLQAELGELQNRATSAESEKVALEEHVSQLTSEVEKEMELLLQENQSLKSNSSSSASAAELAAATEQVQSLEVALEAERAARAEERKRSREEREALTARSTPLSKRGGGDVGDDDEYDIEGALLEGGGGFQPLAGLLRSAPVRARSICTAPPAIAAASYMDKVSVALYRRPKMRLLLLLYALIAHVLGFVFFVR